MLTADATYLNGNTKFKFDGQDAIDVTNTAIKKHGSGGRIGAKGKMNCKSNVVKHHIKWGIYQTLTVLRWYKLIRIIILSLI